jgi:hypothetical protein
MACVSSDSATTCVTASIRANKIERSFMVAEKGLEEKMEKSIFNSTEYRRIREKLDFTKAVQDVSMLENIAT